MIKKVLIILVVVFALFYLFSRPDAAAGAVRSAFGAVGTGVNALVTFFTALAR